ncbi:hypothetical protein KAT84_03510 [Candidatus Bipolaricaulota bacterium]|jgi:hypothetical protein|nr:hypothetical protein [Candidatus Bipolaricaulota bacterium]
MKRLFVLLLVLLVALSVAAMGAKPIHVGGGTYLETSPIHVGGGTFTASSPIHVGGGP